MPRRCRELRLRRPAPVAANTGCVPRRCRELRLRRPAPLSPTAMWVGALRDRVPNPKAEDKGCARCRRARLAFQNQNQKRKTTR
ncbi:MAG: hypothetical protein HC836_27915 [Richelia sp. RM2_1_2]|nr:hypothetical protein [Richelia sp. RM2_1_2]